MFVKRLTETARIPTRGTPGSAGLDLYADEAVRIEPGQWRLISTGISVAIPPHFVGLVWPRSGWARKGITTDAGVIDADYRGELFVLLVNFSNNPLDISPGMRIGQLLIQPVFPHITEVDELPDTERGASGFGSTGA